MKWALGDRGLDPVLHATLRENLQYALLDPGREPPHPDHPLATGHPESMLTIEPFLAAGHGKRAKKDENHEDAGPDRGHMCSRLEESPVPSSGLTTRGP